jgi:hypothetical protein
MYVSCVLAWNLFKCENKAQIISCFRYNLKLCVLKSFLVIWNFKTYKFVVVGFFHFNLILFVHIVVWILLCVLVLDSYIISNKSFESPKVQSSCVVMQLDSIAFVLGWMFCTRFYAISVIKVSFCFNVCIVLSLFLCMH